MIRNIFRFGLLLALILIAKAVVFSPLSAQNSQNGSKSAEFQQSLSKLRHQHPPYHQVIRQYADKHHVDYRLVYAVILQESRFETDAVSHRGATGLMQVMPVSDNSAPDDSDEAGLDLRVPEENIKTGVSYLASLMDLFDGCQPDDQMRLALAAYNAGPSRIYDAQEIAAYMGENPKTWDAVRNALPLLSRRCYTLHRLVWDEGRPRNGNFGEYRQTIDYVENVMDNYRNYTELYQ